MSKFNEMTIIPIIKCFQSHCAISPSRGSIDNGAWHGEYTRAVEIEGTCVFFGYFHCRFGSCLSHQWNSRTVRSNCLGK